MKSKIVLTLALGLALTLSGVALGQGTQYGSLRGQAKLADGSSVPGVLVTATSPASPGVRTTVTSESGQWILRNLIPGAYTVTFELEGMATVQSAATVQLGQETPVNVEMQVAAQEETIIVTGELASVLASSEVSTTYNFEEVNNLPIDRTPSDIAQIAPGLTDNTPNNGQVTISGGFAYDNVFLIDGVDANDNLYGTSNPVYIEDAIADTQILTSGISAEYGRFSGGVVNVITKSGGNNFSGSLRADLENADWRSQTPIEVEEGTELQDEISKSYQATLGGYILKDRLWFFVAGRDEESSTQSTLAATGLPRFDDIVEDRQEYKLTANIKDKHQIQGAFTDRNQVGTRPSFSFSATPDTVRVRTDPSDLVVGRYSGVLTPSLFAELQMSEKGFTFNNTHAFTDPRDSPMLSTGNTGAPFMHYNRPYFDGTDPEDRNNEQLAASMSFFLDSAAAGSHDLKVGYEDFTSTRTGGNSQSSTGLVFDVDPVLDANGDLVFDSGGKLIPNWVPGITYIEVWNAVRGSIVDTTTESLYVNDRWSLNDHWSFNLGFRYEDVTGSATGNITTVDTDRFVPRLAASYDVRGDGKYRVDATYAQYAGKYSESQFAENTTVGNPALLYGDYIGPAGQGLDHAPAFDLSNWDLFYASDGTQNVFQDSAISSPVVDEVTFAVGTELKKGGYLKLIYTDRSYSDFVEDFICTTSDGGGPCNTPGGDTGVTEVIVEGVSAGTFNNTFISNSDIPSRDYESLQLLARYRISDDWYVEGHWTHQLTNDGNFEGEGTNTPGISSLFGNYPGVYTPDRHFPTGRLNDSEEDKIRIWSVYNLGLGRAGNLSIGGLLNYDSGTTFSFSDVTTIGQAGRDARAAYLNGISGNEDAFFGGRGTGEHDGSTTFDLTLNYSLPIYKDLDLWVKFDVVNVLNDDSVIDFFDNVDAVTDGPVDSRGIPTTYTPSTGFGDAEDNNDFPDPREYTLAVGFRF